MAGHGRRMISLPPTFGPTSRPFSSTTTGSTPKNGSVALPGFVGIAPGSGVIRIDPVSVCHHVSTIGQRPPPIFLWYHKNIGGGRCPIVDTWWQTETGSILITPLPGAIPTKPGSATLPFFGVDPAVVDQKGREVEPNV